jgi:hypothetical protein
MNRPRISLATCLVIILLAAVDFGIMRYAALDPVVSGGSYFRMWPLYLLPIVNALVFIGYVRLSLASKHARSRAALQRSESSVDDQFTENSGV